MLEAWEYEMFNSIDSGTLVRLVILLGLMTCVLGHISNRTEKVAR
jgi:hypothetical protein